MIQETSADRCIYWPRTCKEVQAQTPTAFNPCAQCCPSLYQHPHPEPVGVEEVKPSSALQTVEVSTGKEFRHLEHWPAGLTLCGLDMFPAAEPGGKPPSIGFSRGGAEAPAQQPSPPPLQLTGSGDFGEAELLSDITDHIEAELPVTEDDITFLRDLASRLSPENKGYCDQCEQHKPEVANLLEGESLCAPCLLVRATALLTPAEGHDYKLADRCPTCGNSAPENSSGVEEEVAEAFRELDEVALAAWEFRQFIHLNLVEIALALKEAGLEPTVGVALAKALNDLNEHMPLAEDGHVWRMRPVVKAALAPTQQEEAR